jgi:hypoxanthine phosphoribosyltransferase
MPDKKLIISREDIARRVQELGAKITEDFADSKLLVVGALNGAFIFMADLVREIKLDLEIDFIRVASYGMSTSSCGEIRFSKDIELDARDKDILIVEDIVDTGLTLASLHKYLIGCSPKSIRACALIDKKERRDIDVVIDYVGFEVKEGFLIGYGLDCREQYRQLGEIFHLIDP